MTPRIQINAEKEVQIASVKGGVIVSASLSPQQILSFIYYHSPMRDASELYHILISNHQPTECCRGLFCAAEVQSNTLSDSAQEE